MFNIISKISNLTNNKYYWLLWFVFAISLECAALFYQYVLDYLPCVLCIHVRIWLLGILVTAIAALFIYKVWFGRLVSQLLILVFSIGLFESSYQLLGTERGFVFGECNMESGLPVWFALDKWFPSVFKIWEACGYTPELLFGVTMAEALIVSSFLLLIMNSVLVLSLITHRFLQIKS